MKGANVGNIELWGRYKRFDDREAKKLLVLEYAHLVKRTLTRIAKGLSSRADLADLASSGILD
jgi:DNA-directed RNA polymerase specialized sigma subunit